ncbi:MAG: sigma-70 family RNA polymerase sigma factor [Gemmataceae bacterium]|nr:sigma-70 family RNA polymerase sigma factor [Gemmataceae bacterium]
MADDPWQQSRPDAGTALAPATAAPSDGQLLTAYLAHKDRAAFETLVDRHGPLVYGVCHRMLGNAEDAADAFQAVFLVLVRKAASIRRPEVVRTWLYQTAVRTSMKARAIRQRRLAHERGMHVMPEPAAATEVACQEELALLDEELRALPEKYQLPLILCELEGRSRKEAAGILHVAEGTVSSRLAAARKRLAGRLRRRGVVVSLAGLGMLLKPGAAAATMPATLAASTVEAATLVGTGQIATGVVSAKVAALAQGVINSMLAAKVKLVAVVALVLGVLAAGVQVGLAPEGVPEGDVDFYYDFRGSRPVPAALALFPPDTKASITPEEGGLRITAATKGGQTFGWGVSTRFGLAGDFEFTVTYELITLQPPTRGGGAGVALNLAPDHNRRKWAKLGRTFLVKEGSGYTAAFWDKDAPPVRAWVVVPVPGQGPKQTLVPGGVAPPQPPVRAGVAPDQELVLAAPMPALEQFVPSDALTGQLRLAREGSILRYLVAEGAANEFREIYRREFGTENIGLVRFVVNNNTSPTTVDARLVDLRVRTTRKATASSPAAPESAPTAIVPDSNAPARTPARERTWWWLLTLISLLVALLSVALVIRNARRKRGAAMPAGDKMLGGQHPASATFAEFPCPACGKRLKRPGNRAGHKLKCPTCHEIFGA